MNMYNTVYMDERVALTPSEFDIIESTDDIKDILVTKLREIHEKKCNANGYVRPGSIQLIGRSMGVSENGRFTGNYVFDCKFSCEILYPTADMVLQAQIVKINKMGAYAVFEEAMRILLPRDTHVGNTEFDSMKESQMVNVVIDRSRFQNKDAFIMAVGHLASESNGKISSNVAVNVAVNDSQAVVDNNGVNNDANDADDEEEQTADSA
jgi:DNA-directed RNA polymerase subunit E'/Rpb7